MPFLLLHDVTWNPIEHNKKNHHRRGHGEHKSKHTGRTSEGKEDANLEGRITACQLESTALKEESHGDKTQEQNQTPHNIICSLTRARDKSETKERT